MSQDGNKKRREGSSAGFPSDGSQRQRSLRSAARAVDMTMRHMTRRELLVALPFDNAQATGKLSVNMAIREPSRCWAHFAYWKQLVSTCDWVLLSHQRLATSVTQHFTLDILKCGVSKNRSAQSHPDCGKVRAAVKRPARFLWRILRAARGNERSLSSVNVGDNCGVQRQRADSESRQRRVEGEEFGRPWPCKVGIDHKQESQSPAEFTAYRSPQRLPLVSLSSAKRYIADNMTSNFLRKAKQELELVTYPRGARNCCCFKRGGQFPQLGPFPFRSSKPRSRAVSSPDDVASRKPESMSHFPVQDGQARTVRRGLCLTTRWVSWGKDCLCCGKPGRTLPPNSTPLSPLSSASSQGAPKEKDEVRGGDLEGDTFLSMGGKPKNLRRCCGSLHQ